MKRWKVLLTVLFLAGCDGGPGGGEGGATCDTGSGTSTDPEPPIVHPMSYTRLLRRVSLALTGRTPDSQAYDAMLAAKSDAEKEALIESTVDQALESNAFYRNVVAWGHDWISVGLYANALNDSAYHGSQAANLEVCPDASVHAGSFWVQAEDGGPAECDDPAAPVNMVEPWWAPGTTVSVVGRGGTGVRSYVAADGTEVDCGLSEHSYFSNGFKDDPEYKCSCGPNLVYCHPYSGFANAQTRDPALAAMQVWDEPARMLGHIVAHNRPLTDLVLANYTVAPLRLRHLYVRHGRQNPDNIALDDKLSWYQGPFSGPTDPEHAPNDPLAWNEVVVADLDPDLLSLTENNAPSGSPDRKFTYDARTTEEEIEGLPAAGVLTMAGSMASFARERVRGARFVEIFTCRQFIPPPGDFKFNDFDRDPATSGTCQHCHRTLDPAAIFFKRWSFRPSGTGGTFAILGGVGPWRFTPESNTDYDPFRRWKTQYLPGTVLTPATEAEATANPETLLNDFLPQGTLLFGEQGDGTIGPLGFGKILVQSGEFDRCAVQRIYQRFVGRALDPTTEAGYLEALRQELIKGGRNVKSFIRHLISTEDFRRGL